MRGSPPPDRRRSNKPSGSAGLRFLFRRRARARRLLFWSRSRSAIRHADRRIILSFRSSWSLLRRAGRRRLRRCFCLLAAFFMHDAPWPGDPASNWGIINMRKSALILAIIMVAAAPATALAAKAKAPADPNAASKKFVTAAFQQPVVLVNGRRVAVVGCQEEVSGSFTFLFRKTPGLVPGVFYLGAFSSPAQAASPPAPRRPHSRGRRE